MIETDAFKVISEALSICMPITKEDAERDCVECPFYEVCGEEESIAFPTSLAIAIRSYFAPYSGKKTMIQ